MRAGIIDPVNRALVVWMIVPTPGHEHIHIEKIIHGKSASISLTVSVVKGIMSGVPWKISTPVSGQRFVSGDFVFFFGAPRTFFRKYSDTVSRAPRAAARSLRASSGETLKVMVGMVIRYYQR